MKRTVKNISKKDPVPEDASKDIQTLAEELLGKLRLDASIDVRRESEDHYTVTVSTEERGLLIGYHGETLNGFQLLLGIILYKKLGKWLHVVVDVGDYRRMREENIREIVARIIREVEVSGQPVSLPYLTPLERRFVHMMLSDHAHVVSESVGEGRNRRLMIKPRGSGDS